MPYKVVHNHILGTKADTIVCPVNRLPVCTPGIEMDVYREAGADEMLQARKEVGVIDPGHAVITDGFHSKAKHIIHTVTPKWIDGDHGEYETLHECYKNSFKCTKDLNCSGVAVPLLMSDVHTFPKKKALDIAMDEIGRYLRKNDIMVYLIVYHVEDFEPSENLIAEIDELLGIKENSNAKKSRESLDEVLSVHKESFGDRLFRLIDERGYSDTEVYKRANVDRRVVSRLRQEPDKNVNKNTALALAVGLRLTAEETKEFIELAGWGLSPSKKYDRIIRYFIENGNYNMTEINEALFKYTKKTLGV